MATSQYVTNYSYTGEQRLLENLVAESVRLHGEDMYYCPRRLNNYDKIYGADTVSTFDRAILIEFYFRLS